MSDLARPLSMQVIIELMGLPPKDIHIFERWTSDFTRSLSLSVADYINEDEKEPSTCTKAEKTDVTIKSLQNGCNEVAISGRTLVPGRGCCLIRYRVLCEL